jgi:hypothetical protein
MTNKNSSFASSALVRMVGSFGLVLIVLLGWACEQRTGTPHTPAMRARRALAWLAVESITAIGWAIDRIAPVDTRDDASEFAAVHLETHGEPRG